MEDQSKYAIHAAAREGKGESVGRCSASPA